MGQKTICPFWYEKGVEIQQRYKVEGKAIPSANELEQMVKEEWKALSNEEQKTWNDKAAAEKERYFSELNDYKGPWKLPSPNAAAPVESCPKRPPSAFDATEEEIDHILNLEWTNLSEEAKSVYLDQEWEARQKYKAEMQEWRKQCAANKEAGRLQKHGDAT